MAASVLVPNNNNAPRSIFPDGIRTSGTTDPLFDLLKPTSSFPQRITGPTVWSAEDYADKPDQWIHRFTPQEQRELSEAADAFIAAGHPLTGITKDNFPLPTLSARLDALRHDLLNGKGFILFKDFPVLEFGVYKSAVGYMGLGTHLGYFVSQNGRGHILGHVKDVGDDPTQIDRVRIYRTNARQFFHTDDCDIVGLLCVHRALEGGESDIVSTHHVYNTIREERPDLFEALTRPDWYFDRKGEKSNGQQDWTMGSVFYLEPDGPSTPRVYSYFDPYYVKSLSRFSDKGVIPPLSDVQKEAAQYLEDTCMRLALHMILEVGDIQFLSNSHVYHSRTAYVDHPPPAPRRHLMRLWLSTPESEGGWRLALASSDEKKRRGVQVNDNAPTYPLDAE